MGNNPSRNAATPQHPHQQSSTSSSPSHAPTRAPSTSSRKASHRRNSLQPPASAKHFVPAAPGATTQDFPTHARHRDPRNPTHHPRRESIAETITGGYAVSPSRARDGPFDDTPLRRFPSPPTVPQPQIGRPGPPAGGDHALPHFADIRAPPGDAMPRRRGSLESTTTVDEDEPAATDSRTIPTLVTWPHEGNKVYLTGTFCSWSKRFKLQKSPVDGTMSAVIAIPPGTHHVKFLVDNEMRTSDALPQAVDDTGILVNYLEVSADEMPPLDRQASNESQHESRESESSRNINIATTAEDRIRYTSEIPPYLRDFADSYGDDREESRGLYGSSPPPAPPSLPMMLQKVVLNTSSQMKDDASVLTIPNHAVLNHLATSSIKNQVLAVSATTRYKKKYVTTILYKAAHD